MKTINKVHLVGRVGRRMKHRIIKDKNRYAFYISTEGTLNTNKLLWHHIVLYTDFSSKDFIINQGDFISVEGKIITRSYIDTTGVKKYITDILAEKITTDRGESWISGQ